MLERSEQIRRLQRIRHVALDMDGTLYLGGKLFPQTLPFLKTLQSLGIGHTFLTNNSSRSTAEYVRHLSDFGIAATSDDVFISTHAAISLLHSTAPDVKVLFTVGTAGFHRDLQEAGFTVQPTDKESVPDAVLLGFDTDLDYARLCKATYWIQQGLPYFATHPDFVCPTNKPTVLLDCGAVIAAIESATGRRPDAIAGKPEPAMLQALARRHQLGCDEIAMVGDRLYTDVKMAKRAGGLGILTLTGETQKPDIPNSETQPDIVIENIGELGYLLIESRNIVP